MQLEQSFLLPVPPSSAWLAFQDIPQLVGCLPGAAITGTMVDESWPMRFDVKLGPIAAGFLGTGRVSFDDAGHQGRFEGSAIDRRTNSRVKGVAAFALVPEGEGSLVRVSVDYSLTGSLAQFSRAGIVRELAGALTTQFAANLSAALQASVVAPAADVANIASGAGMDGMAGVDGLPGAGGLAAEPTAPATVVVAAKPASPAVALNVGALLWQVVRRRWLDLRGRLQRGFKA
jgi:hypothetical protein